MQNIRDYVIIGVVVASAAFGGAYFGSTPKGMTADYPNIIPDTDTQPVPSASFFSMPEVNDENCKPANINNVSSLHREEFAEKCFKRGAVERKPSKAY